MRSSNPVFKDLTANGGAPQQYGNPYGNPYGAGAGFGQQNPYQQSPFGAGVGQQPGFPGALAPAERAMTVDDVISKTGITLGVIIAVAIVNFFIGTVAPGLAMGLALVGAIGGLITVLVSTFGKKYGSAAVTLTYAVFEGLLVGGISYMFASMTVSSVSAGVLIGQAVLGTLGVFAGMLYVYKTGAVKVTPKFTRLLMGGFIGVLVLMLGNFVGSFFGFNVLRDGGPLSIVFSLVCIGLAAMSFLQDFDNADKLVRAGAPAKMAWGVALGLAVTLVWLYTEILRLLSYFNNR